MVNGVFDNFGLQGVLVDILFDYGLRGFARTKASQFNILAESLNGGGFYWKKIGRVGGER